MRSLLRIHTILGRDQQKGVVYHPVPVGVGSDVGPLKGVGAQVKDLGYPESHQRLRPNRTGALHPLFHEDELPVVVTQASQVAIVAEIEKGTRGLCGSWPVR